ncbi:hypothetical protein CcaverHIS631_0408740 [Cutaneotrichosporon cavernicola]|nr:hypothetical protein CcaverHIS631_0408740 [Cutaneotrichosporon cavernicola]BEJ07607.1 hypothetical protein CcaverHIS641_0408760 [Cutaneotrichosporon cavernicola]
MPESQLPWASGDESPGSHSQERLPSSQSMSSLVYNSRGRRAPAPAALDLGHREHIYSAEPESLAYTSDRRLDLTMPVPRPLPTAPAGRRVSMQQTLPNQPSSPPRMEPVPFPTHHSPAASRTFPLQTVPLSAVGGLGLGPLDDQRSSVVVDPRASVATNGGDRVSYVSIDSYYLNAGTGVLSPGGLSPGGLSPGDLQPPYPPSTPEYMDPSNIDRRGLIGVGELATPRWGPSDGRHLRTPSMSQDLALTPPLPPLDRSTFIGSGPGRQATIPVNLSVMERVTEESPRRERVRHRSVSHDTPKRNPRAEQQQQEQPIYHSPPSAPPIDSVISSLGDFSFDSTIEPGTLADSLAMPEPRITPPRNLRASAPPAPQHSSLQSFGGLQSQIPTALPPVPPPNIPESATITPPVPGSARERIYARRMSRQHALAAAGGPAPQMVEIPPLPVLSSAMSPPTSADSHTQSFSSRKTPPGNREPVASKRRVPSSPSAPHHDILRHIAPKDFSHLPPSPSTASISHLLRGSASGHNLSQVHTPPGSISVPGKPPITRSDSIKSSRSRAQSMKAGEASATAEALRKLDGLGATPRKTGAAGTITPRRASSPPDTTRRLTSKQSASSIHNWRDKDLWMDNTPEQLAAQQARSGVQQRVSGAPSLGGFSDVPPLTFEKRESSPSVVGTPTSRESHGLPSTTTRPLSGHRDQRESRDIRAEKSMRRPSFASDLSLMESTHEQIGGHTFVPPVPPLPRGYQSMRQGLSTIGSSNPLLPSQYVALQPEEMQRTTRETSAPPALTFPSPNSHHSSDAASHQTIPLADTPRTRTMSKKWSFSSALSLNKLHGHGREKEPSTSPTLSPSLATANSSMFEPSSPPTPWKDDKIGLASPRAQPLDHVRSRDSIDVASSIASDARSNHSITPIATNGTSGLVPPLPKSNSKRLTPSSIPFFRRSSASSASLAKLASAPDQHQHYPQQASAAVPRHSGQTVPAPSGTSSQRTPSGSSRKSMLGMHIPAMLRGSASKRGLASQQVAAPQVEKQAAPTATQTSTIGHARARRMTLSSGGDNTSFASLTRKPSVDSRVYQPTSHESTTVNGNGNATPTATSHRDRASKLPVAGQQSLHSVSSASSLRKVGAEAPGRVPPAATPTKIPRIASRPSVTTPNSNTNVAAAHMSMPPPVVPHSSFSHRTSTQFNTGGSNTIPGSTSVNDISEFGAVSGSVGTRQSLQRPPSFGSHRSHLHAPGSSRKHSVSGIPAPPSSSNIAAQASRRETMGAAPAPSAVAGLPASRRTLPQIPSSATAMTISAAAKARPAVSRRGSGSPTVTEEPAPNMKLSKSFHSKAATSGHSRMSLSSSVGAVSGSRRQSLATESTGSSPVDDEEAIADAEMGAYVTRRKARAAAGSKKDDLSDLIGFPEDIGPAQPVSQRAFIGSNLNSLSDYERKEVLDFDFIYYMARGVKRPKQPDGKVYNHGYDDERGDYVVVEGDHLSYRYEVVGILGKGSFGQVVHCRDHKTGGSVAVKIIRNKKRFHAQALVEVKILQQIVDWDPEDKHYMVKMTDHFYFRGHLCIVTELLSINLYELIKANQFNGFSTVVIRRFTTQMLSSLMLMRSHRIVHCDLKPENILLRHPAKSGIKVIDFGSSCHESEKVYTYIQSRFYRSPEVILGMNYAMAIDMWSLGCILAELYTGYPIFPGENEHEQLACIMEVLGVPDHYIVQKASRRKLFFDATGAPRPFVNAKGKRRRPGTKTLSSVLKCNDDLFIDFISKCLTWDPDKRLKPQPAMRHPWILAGRRRSPPPQPERESRASFLGSSARRSTVNGDKKSLVISPPTPLVARAPQAPQSASRIGVSVSTARLHARNSTYVPNAQKVSMA